ncbi:MAG: hypothetical protein JWM73_2720 [Solirubrobacterales bacterium]|jgi:hypothetical protein|nr:hypothetical protein [Solirubrobacterales bacterium]
MNHSSLLAWRWTLVAFAVLLPLVGRALEL